MVTKQKLIKVLKKEVKQLEDKIELANFYNTRNKVFRNLIKCGIFLDKILPYIVGFTISGVTLNHTDVSPFKIDQVIEYSTVSETKTSSGDILKTESFTEEYENYFIYSTGWIVNEIGLYERKVYTFNFSDLIEYEIDDILDMSQEELCSLFTIHNIENIQKTTLSEDDYIYDEDMILINNVYENEENYRMRDEYWYEIFFSFLFLIFSSCFFGLIIKKIVIKDKIKDKLVSFKRECSVIKPEDIEAYKKILKIKRDNLRLLGIEETSDKELKKVML